MGKSRLKLLFNGTYLFVLCMVVICLLNGYVVEAEETDSLYEQIYEANLQIYTNAPKDQATLDYYLKEEISAEIRDAAIEITEHCETDMEKLKAIHDWVASNIYYDYYGRARDLTNYLSHEVYDKKGTVCAGYSNLTASMCRAVGIPCKIIIGYAFGECKQSLLNSGYTNHAWNEAYIDGRWVILDTTWDSQNANTTEDKMPVFKKCKQVYFNPTLEYFSRTHSYVNTREEFAYVDSEIDRNIDENIKLRVSVKDNKIMFDWDWLEDSINYELQYDVVNGGVFGIAYEKDVTFSILNTIHYEEPIELYGDCWPMYFRLRRIKNDGTIWYSHTIEFYPSYTVTFMDGTKVISTQIIQFGESATPPLIEKDGYVLVWDGVYTNIKRDVIINAIWKKKEEVTKPSEEEKKEEIESTVQTPENQASIDNEESKQNTEKIIAKPKKVTGLKVKNKKTKKITVSWTNQIDVDGYQTQIATKKNFKTGKKARITYLNKTTWTKLKKGKTYYIRVRAYRYDEDFNKKYGAWSAVKKIKVKK